MSSTNIVHPSLVKTPNNQGDFLHQTCPLPVFTCFIEINIFIRRLTSRGIPREKNNANFSRLLILKQPKKKIKIFYETRDLY